MAIPAHLQNRRSFGRSLIVLSSRTPNTRRSRYPLNYTRNQGEVRVVCVEAIDAAERGTKRSRLTRDPPQSPLITGGSRYAVRRPYKGGTQLYSPLPLQRGGRNTCKEGMNTPQHENRLCCCSRYRVGDVRAARIRLPTRSKMTAITHIPHSLIVGMAPTEACSTTST